MERTTFVEVFRRWWITLVVAMLMGGITGYVIADRSTAVYEAEVRLLVGPISADGTTLRAASQLTQTYAELVTTQPLLDDAASSIGTDVRDFDGRVDALPNDVTRLLTLRVRSDEAPLAADMANSLAAVLQRVTQADVIRPEGQLQVVEAAAVPTSALPSNATLVFLLSVLSALVAAAGLVLVLDYLADAVQDVDELPELTGADLVVELTRRRPSLLRRIRGLLRPGGMPPEPQPADVELAATTLQLALPPGARALVVAGAGDRSASGAFAGRLADVLAGSGKTVALADVAGGEALEAAGVSIGAATDSRRLHCVTLPIGGDAAAAAVAVDDDVAVVDEPEVRAKLDLLLIYADWVVIHVGPIEQNPTALVWGRVADGIVLVVRRSATRRRAVIATTEHLRRVGGRVIGAILIDPGWDGPMPGRFHLPSGSRRAEDPASPAVAPPGASGGADGEPEPDGTERQREVDAGGVQAGGNGNGNGTATKAGRPVRPSVIEGPTTSRS